MSRARPNRYAARLRGELLKRRVRCDASGLRVYGRIHVSRPAPGTTLRFGAAVQLFGGVQFYLDAAGASIEIGDRTYLNRNTAIMCKESVIIGADCAISWDVNILDTDYHAIAGADSTAPVEVGDHVWVGARSTILKGVRVGDGVVIAAGSVVTRDVPPRSLVGGNPARVIRDSVEWR